jgi:hypothetical protein
MLLIDSEVNQAIEAIIKTARTGKIGVSAVGTGGIHSERRDSLVMAVVEWGSVSNGPYKHRDE